MKGRNRGRDPYRALTSTTQLYVALTSAALGGLTCARRPSSALAATMHDRLTFTMPLRPYSALDSFCSHLEHNQNGIVKVRQARQLDRFNATRLSHKQGPNVLDNNTYEDVS